MLKETIALFIALMLYGCTTTTSHPENVDNTAVKMHTLATENSKTLSFKSSGCIIIKEGSLKNDAAYASAGSYGKLIISNSKSISAVDQYHVSCGAAAAGGKSSCVIQHIDGSGTSKEYGGAGCPDMKFKLTNFKSF